MKKLSPHQLRSVLTALDQGLSYRQAAQKTLVSKTSISRIDCVSRNRQQNYQDLLKLDDNELTNAIYPPELGSYTEPDWEVIHKQLHRKNVTLRLLFERYLIDASRDTYNYPSFCRRYTQWKRDNGISTAEGNVERIPGERMEVDFAGDRLEWIDDNGDTRYCKLFVASLPYSNMIFTEAFEDETQPSWINGIVDALEYFGAVPSVLVMDNAKALIRQAGWREGDAHPAIRSLCMYYGMEPWACKPASPKQKNRVEAAVHDVERWIIAQLTLEQQLFASDLRDVNEKVRKRLDAINDQPFRGKHRSGSRRLVYQQEEINHMHELPSMPYEAGFWKVLTVDKAHCVRIASENGHRYSTPAKYVGKQVVVRVARDTVEIFDQQTMERLGVHQRCFDQRGSKTHILPDHLTPAEKHYRRSAEEWVDVLVLKGLNKTLAVEFVTSLRYGKGDFPSTRICGAVCGLFRSYQPQTINRAVAEALEDQNLRAQYIRTLCDRYEFAQQTNGVLDFNGNSDQIVMHSNIRNNYK